MSEENEESTEQVEATSGGEADGGGKMVTYSRFHAVVSERNSLREAHEEAKAAAVELRATAQAERDQLAEQLATVQGSVSSFESQQARLQRDLTLSRVHQVHDPEVASYLDYRYTQATKDTEEPPAFEDWFTEYAATQPAILRTAGTPAAPKAAPPKINGSAQEVASSEDALDPASMSIEQYKSHRDELLKHGIKVGRPVY